MTVTQLDPEELVHWALETGIWDGRPTSSPQLPNDLARRITTLLFEKEGFEFYEMATQLALLGTNEPEEIEAIRRDLLEAGITPNGMVIQIGFMKSVKKFWKKHKVAIIIGVAAVSLSAGVAIVALSKLNEERPEPSSPPPAKPSPKPTARPQPTKEPTVQTDPLFLRQPVPPQDTSQIPSFEMPKFTGISSESRRFDPFHPFPEKIPNPVIQVPRLDSKTELDLPKDWPKISAPPKEPPTDSSIPKWPSQQPLVQPLLSRPEEIQASHSFLGYLAKLVGYDVCQHTGTEDLPLPNYSEIQTSQRVVSVPDPSIPYRIGGNNGIWTSPKSAQENWNYLKKMMPPSTPTEVVYNNTHALLDVLETVFLNLSGYSPNTAKLHQEGWAELHEKNKDRPDLKFLQFCHSQGVIHVKNALSAAPQEIRDRVIVIALGPATTIPKNLCFRAHHYASKRDFVYLAEDFKKLGLPMLVIKLILKKIMLKKINPDELVLLDPHQDAPLFDHAFQSPTFYNIIKKHIDDYLSNKGEYVSKR